MLFFDRTTVTTRKITPEGFMLATARVGRPGIQEYAKGIDFNDSDLPERLRMRPFGSTLRILRPRNEVFNDESMQSFSSKPITNNHPSQRVVDSSNVKQLQVGFSKEVSKARDGESVEANVVIQDNTAVRAVQGGKDQISLGYEAEVDFAGGIDPEYGPYDGVMRNIKGNHIALVDKARAGADFRLNDNNTTKGQTKMKVRVIDGISIELSDDAAAIFDKMKAENIQLKADAVKLGKQITDSATELETVKGERDAAKLQTLTDADIDKKVAERVQNHVALVDSASKVCDEDFAGKTAREIRCAVIKRLGDGRVKIEDSTSDAYVQAVYDTLVATANPKEKQIADGLSGDKGLDAREEMKKRRGGK